MSVKKIYNPFIVCLLTVIEFNPDAASFSVGDTYFNRICCIIQMFRFSSLLKPHDLSTERTGKKNKNKNYYNSIFGIQSNKPFFFSNHLYFFYSLKVTLNPSIVLVQNVMQLIPEHVAYRTQDIGPKTHRLSMNLQRKHVMLPNTCLQVPHQKPW